jgi:hypothetical protein
MVRPKECPSSWVHRAENRLAQFMPVKNRQLTKHDRQLIANHFDAEPLALRQLIEPNRCKVVNLRGSIPNKMVPSLLVVALLVDHANLREFGPKPLKPLDNQSQLLRKSPMFRVALMP